MKELSEIATCDPGLPRKRGGNSCLKLAANMVIFHDKQISNKTKFSRSHVKNIFEYAITGHSWRSFEKKKQFFKLFKVPEELTVQDYWRINSKSILENKIPELPARVLWPEKLRTE